MDAAQWNWSDCLAYSPDEAAVTSSQKPPLLTALSASAVCKDATAVATSTRLLPRRLTELLLRNALSDLNYDSVEAILCNYPNELLVLRAIGLPPPRTTDYQFLARMATTVVKCFLDSLENRDPLSLHTLDMRGYPLGGAGLNFLSAHGLVSFKEGERRLLINTFKRKYERAVALQCSDPVADQMLAELRTRLADEQVFTTLPVGRTFELLIDCVLRDSESDLFDNFCQLLKVNEIIWRNVYASADADGGGDANGNVVVGHQGGLCTFVNSIQLVGMPSYRVEMLFELLNPLHLTGVSLHSCALPPDLLVNVARFTQLTQLEVAYPDQLQAGTVPLQVVLVAVIGGLPSLRRLALKGVDLSSRVGTILAGCNQTLDYLALVSCRLTSADMMRLSTANTTLQQLKYLNLSGNQLHGCVTALCCLLKLLRPTLDTLVLNGCELGDNSLSRVAKTIQLMPELVVLEMAANPFFSVEAFETTLMDTLATHESVRTVALSMPNELHVERIDNNIVYMYSKQRCLLTDERFIERMTKSFVAKCVSVRGTDVRPPLLTLLPPNEVFPNNDQVMQAVDEQ